MNGKDTKHQEDELSPPSRCSASSGAADASTQTDEGSRGSKLRETCTRGVSTNDGTIDSECTGDCHNHAQRIKQGSQMYRNSLSPPTSSSASSSGGITDTLESLIRTDASKINGFRIPEEEDVKIPPNPKLKASNILMQLISCGSISVKDHSFGLVPNYRPQFSHLKFPSPLYSTSVMLGELDCLSENPRLMGLRLEDKEYFSGSLIETKVLKEGDSHISLKSSSSFNSDRLSKQLEENADEEATSARSKCLPLSIKASGGKQPRSESMRYPISGTPRTSSAGHDKPNTIARDAPNGNGKRITEPSLENKVSNGSDSFREEKEKIIKIEERLASGARVIIQSKET